MDIAMDIAAAMDEIRLKKPDITPRELIRSGFTVGRQVIGTMTTTLLLAYSGGYLTLLMVFRVKDPSFMRMINLKIVSAEILRTLIGSIGLVMVAPITALLGGLIMLGLAGQTHSLKEGLHIPDKSFIDFPDHGTATGGNDDEIHQKMPHRTGGKRRKPD